MEIYNKLNFIQQNLKAPKDQFNSFGGYKYRSCESILEAVKPALAETETTVTLSDGIEAVGGRVYVRSTATLTDIKNPHDCITVTAYAREEDTKKGMDASQVTGAASSYARKYALNGLFCIDDNKDSDATNAHGKDNKPEENAPRSNGEGFIPKCAVCGVEITEKVHDYSAKKFGKPLCMSCQKKS